MRQILISLICLLPLVGNAEVRTYANLAPFHQLKAQSHFIINYEISTERYAEVDAPEAYFEYIELGVKEGTLLLTMRNSIPSRLLRTPKEIRVKVYGPVLDEIQLSGACQFNSQDLFAVPEMDIDVAGAAQATLNVDCQELDFDIAGAAMLSIGGNARQVDGEVSGASKVDLNVNTRGKGACSLDLEVSAASKAQVDMSGDLDKCEVSCSGASSVTLVGGRAHSAEFEVSGASKLNAEDFPLHELEIEAGGASKARVNVSQVVRGRITGSSKVYCKGGATYQGAVNGFISE